MPDPGDAATVLVLVPGATYNHVYWDFPYEPSTYSFSRAMNEAGYATFAVDRLGTGESSRPLSLLVGATAQAQAVHKVIEKLRAGQVGGEAFSNVVLVGHSLGSEITAIEAGLFHDVDGVILTGYTHQLDPLGVATAVSSLHPAAVDPQFVGQGYDVGYLTTKPGTRENLFYAPATTDPNVVDADEQTKDVVTGVEIADGGLSLPSTLLIDVPVLLANGDQDKIFCLPLTGNCDSTEALHAQEAPFYSAAACLQTHLLSGAGHDVNLATNTAQYQEAVRDWADEFVGAGPQSPPGSC